MAAAPRSLMILIAGPYRSGTGDDPEKIAAKVKRGLRIFRRLEEVPGCGSQPPTGLDSTS